MLASYELLGRHSICADKAHHGFDLLLSGEAHFFHPNSIIRLSIAFETPAKSSSAQKYGMRELGFSARRNPSICLASLALSDASEIY